MHRSFPLLVLVVATLAVPLLSAQDTPLGPPQAPRPMPPAPPPSSQNVRVDVTISLKADGKPLTKSLSMVTADGKISLGRAGIEIPVPTQIFQTSSGAPTAPFVSYTYRGVSVNVDATPNILDNARILLRLKLNFATVYKPESGQGSQPSFGNGSHEVQGIVFESGKPVVVTQAVDAETGRDYSVQVTATILK
jgi:hypothetical protein